MLKSLYPDLYISRIWEIDYEILDKLGTKGIICDLDNTIVPWDEDSLSVEMLEWFSHLKENQISICLLSNSLHSRVIDIAAELQIQAIPAAGKPRKRAFKKAVDKLNLPKENILVIGDQIFTDILGGNRLGLTTILVKPMAEKEFFLTNLTRRLERRVLDNLEMKDFIRDN